MWNSDYRSAVAKLLDDISTLCTECYKAWNSQDSYTQLSALEESLKLSKCRNLEGTQRAVRRLIANVCFQFIQLQLTKPTGPNWDTKGSCPAIVCTEVFERIDGKTPMEATLVLLSDSLLVINNKHLLFPPVPLSKVETLDIASQEILELKLDSKVVLDLRGKSKDAFLKNLYREKDRLLIHNPRKATFNQSTFAQPSLDENSVQLSRVFHSAIVDTLLGRR